MEESMVDRLVNCILKGGLGRKLAAVLSVLLGLGLFGQSCGPKEHRVVTKRSEYSLAMKRALSMASQDQFTQNFHIEGITRISGNSIGGLGALNVTKSGKLLLLNNVAQGVSQIVEYDSNGRVVGLIGHVGRKPGEYQSLQDLPRVLITPSMSLTTNHLDLMYLALPAF